MSKPLKQVHIAAHFPGVNNTTVWSDPRSGSHIEFSSFEHFATAAERGKLDFIFLAEGLRLREQKGQIYDLDVVGRPDNLTILAAIASITSRIGVAATVSTTFNEPYELAREFATLDHLSGGRAAWNVVTSWDAFTGENFRRGGYLSADDRYRRANAFLDAAFELFASWSEDEILADKASGKFLAHDNPGAFEYKDDFFNIYGNFNIPTPPQGRPVIIQAGDSPEGREFAAAKAEVIFTGRSGLQDGKDFYADVKRRLPKYGRAQDQLLIMPAATFALADTDEEAKEYAEEIRRAQISGATAVRLLEQFWNRDLSSYDPDGPLPESEPDVVSESLTAGRASTRHFGDRLAKAKEWREIAEAEKLSIRELVLRVGLGGQGQTFVGSPTTIANQINDLVQADASDGFIIVPHITPSGLDDFVDKVIPVLQEKGVFRNDYEGTTLRDHLGLDQPGEINQPDFAAAGQ